MFLILISLITGFIGLVIGGPILGIAGFLSPTIFLIQKIYIKLESLQEIDLYESDRRIEISKENETIPNNCEVCPTCGIKNNGNEQYCIGCGYR